MIDLHTHSTASDGSCTPERLIELALAAGLRALALTDHDTLDGVARARARRGNRPAIHPGSGNRDRTHRGGVPPPGHRDRAATWKPCWRRCQRVQAARRGRNARMVEKMQAGGHPHHPEGDHGNRRRRHREQGAFRAGPGEEENRGLDRRRVQAAHRQGHALLRAARMPGAARGRSA